jgi:hypothetical protein
LKRSFQHHISQTFNASKILFITVRETKMELTIPSQTIKVLPNVLSKEEIDLGCTQQHQT